MQTIKKFQSLKILGFLIVYLFCSCSYKFGALSKYNAVESQWMNYFANNQAALNFITLGDYDFYSNKNFKPTKNFNQKWVNNIKKNHYKFLTIAETWTDPYYFFAVQYKMNDLKTTPDTSIGITKIGETTLYSKVVINEKYDFLFSLLFDSYTPLDFRENPESRRIEFEDIIGSIKFTKDLSIETVAVAVSFILAKQNPALTINRINKINLDSVTLEMADFYLQIKTTAWGFLDELDSANSVASYKQIYINKRMGIELNQNEIDSVRSSKKALVDDTNSIKNFYENAKIARVVVINESHNNWKHRTNASVIIDALNDNGYNYLALEALNYSDTEQLNERKYPIQNTGYYTSEPTFGNLIRNAAKKGFSFLAYEDDSNDREEGQARNINQFLVKYPKEKLIVYCGWDHISQDSSVANPSMTYLLQTKYKIPIVTLNQTEFMVDYFSNETNLSENFLVKAKNEFIYSDQLYNDYYLLGFSSDTLQNSEKLMPVNHNIIRDSEFPITIRIYNKQEVESHQLEAVPVFIQYLNDPNDKIFFDFDVDQHTLLYFDVDGSILN